MATPVIMPRQGQSVESCIISRWFKSLGEIVKKGDILFAYETDKASFEVEAETEGVLLERLYEEGAEVPVLQIVAYLGNQGEALPQTSSVNISTNLPNVPVPEVDIIEINDTGEITAHKASVSYESKIRISPRARNRAASLGIIIENIQGTGPNGRIMEQDVLKAAKSLSPVTPLAKEIDSETKSDVSSSDTGLGGRISPFDVLSHGQQNGEDFEIAKISNVRRIIAKKMHESLQNSAQLTHHTSADARAMLQLRKRVKEASEKGTFENVTINDMVCFAVIKALKKHPNANCHLLGNNIKKFRKVHLGFAVDTERGLMVPTLKNADDLTIRELSSHFKAIANKCKKGNVDPELLASESASFTVSNLGSYGVELFTPVINLPQVAILGVNTIIYRPADLGNDIFGFIPYIGLSLTYDHRALDGAPASAFLREIKFEIEKLDFEI
jgi:pyruvate dehydrogenase E2 component (dihydrolipoamide acetyltransferase)